LNLSKSIPSHSWLDKDFESQDFPQQGSICCGYGSTGKATSGYDCVIIPGAMKMTASTLVNNLAICGAGGLAVATAVIATGGNTICSKSTEHHFK
jgi:hypothetical protein